MNAANLKKKFNTGKLTKREYIEGMYRHVHSSLFETVELIRDSIAKSMTLDKDGVTMLTEDGIRLKCKIGDRRLIPFEILNFGDYEGDLWRYVVSQLGTPKVVLDVGGNIGYFSLFFSSKLPKATFHCFEPCRPTFDQMVGNIKLNRATKRIIPHNFGFSDKDGFFDFYYDPAACGSSSMQNLLQDKQTRLLKCELRTLDDFVNDEGIKHVDFIKFDIEGSEWFAIKGALKTLKRDRPIVFCEMLRKWTAKFGYHPNDIIRTLAKIGYRCNALNENGMHTIREVTDETAETNFLFIAK